MHGNRAESEALGPILFERDQVLVASEVHYPPIEENRPKDLLPVLQLRNVTRTFGGGAVAAVDGLSLDIYPGEIVSILGPSGCGKTTTMRMIAGLDEPTDGDIRVFGNSVIGQAPHLRNIGLVFQSLAIFPHMSVYKNVAFGLRMKGMAAQAIERKVKDMLDLVHLPPDEYGSRMPSQLSGGQLQRVALARTLVTEPSLVLFDEPMAALDRRLRDYMAVELRRIQRDLNVSAIYVTHDQETASAMSDRIAVMQEGKLTQIGTPEQVYKEPVNRFVAEFLGDINVLNIKQMDVSRNGRRVAFIADGSLVVEDGVPDNGQSKVVIVRPEHVEFNERQPREATLSGKVIDTQFGSGLYRTRIRLSDGQELIANYTDSTAAKYSPGSTVWITVQDGCARTLIP